MAQKLAECYYDEDVVNEDLSCHPHPRKWIQMLLKLKETLTTENKLRLLCIIRKVHEILKDIQKSVRTAAETVYWISFTHISISHQTFRPISDWETSFKVLFWIFISDSKQRHTWFIQNCMSLHYHTKYKCQLSMTQKIKNWVFSTLFSTIFAGYLQKY